MPIRKSILAGKSNSMSHESPSIDFHEVRALNGRQSAGFEDLVCQLAGLELRPAGSEFIRKGKGRDAGLECFVRHDDGTECGWQVKYSWSFDPNLVRSLNESLSAALTKHPRLTTLIVCLPFDLSDARGAATTPRQQFDDWRVEKVAEAATSGRTLEILLWDAHALGERLSSDDPRLSGRRLYWFGTKHLTSPWFAEQFERTRSNLGSRYTAQTNVTLPVRRALIGLAHDPELLNELADHRERLREAAAGVKRAGHLDAAQTSIIDEAARCLDAIEDLRAEHWPVNQWRDVSQAALDLVRSLYHAELGRREETRKGPRDEGASADVAVFRNALERLDDLVDALGDELWSVAAVNAVLVTGDAGAGKSHLLADACAHQLAKGLPALLFMGSSLAEADIWPQLITQLGLPAYYTRDTLLGALDAAGEASGTRALLMIDAINERHGRKIWPDRLGSFLMDAAKFPNIAVVLSCRSTNVAHTVPDGLGPQTLLHLEHSGFSAQDARAYLAMRGIVLADHPFLDTEMGNPLFLKTCCDALERDGQTRFPKGMRGVTAIFSMYRSAVCSAIERRLNLASRRRFPERAIEALAQEIERTRETYIALERAFELVDDVLPGGGDQDSDLLQQLESEGVVAIETAASDDGLNEYVRFTFERFADHVVAGAVLDDSLVDGNLPSPLSPDSPLARACGRDGLPWGVREALAVQLPERTSIELADALVGLSEAHAWNLVTPETVRIRTPSSVTERTLELLGDAHGEDDVWDALVRLSIDADSAFDADWLHGLLKPMSLAERDADWSTFVASRADDTDRFDNSAAADLIAWARATQAAQTDPDTARRAAITLTWFLSTSNRRARDTATIGLVNLVTAFPAIALQLLELFDGVNDPYVGERLSAAIYGAALQGSWEQADLAAVANEVVTQFFQRGPLPLDMLWRDHLSSLLQYAETRGCRDIVPPGVNLLPPFVSAWPLEPVPDALVESFTRTYGKGVVHSDEIVSSTGEHGDFASYVIKYAVSGWSPAARGIEPPPTHGDLFHQWRAEFDAYATPTMVALFDAMNAVRAAGHEWTYAGGEAATRHRQLEGEFLSALGSERFERYRVMARYWRPGLGRSENAAEFDVAWARRWVCMRAHELGWSEELHGDFDRASGHGRNNHRHERIGKKYQWIALHELMARISDNCAAADGDWSARYRETVRRLRKIDPSRLMEESHDWGWASFREPTFWMPFVPRRSDMPLDLAWDWLDEERDTLDGPQFIDLPPDAAGQKWLPLGSFQHFRMPGTTEDTEPIRRETWLRLNCLVVRATDEAAALAQLTDSLFLSEHDLGLHQDGLDDWYLGEYDWRNDPTPQWTRWWGNRQDRRAGVEAVATTLQFLQEAGNYDYSLKQNFSVRLPAPWLIQALGLHLNDGRAVRYADARNATVIFDPSVDVKGPSAALVLRRTFLEMCSRMGLVPLWVLAGAKELHVNNSEVYGRRNFTTVYGFDGEIVTGRLYTKESEERREDD